MNNHDRMRELLPLFVSDELPPEDQQLVSKHLTTCAECRADVGELRSFARFLGEHPPVEVSDSLLRQARGELHRRLLRESGRWSFSRFFGALAGGMLRPAYVLPAGAVALFVAGVFAGSWALRPHGAQEPEETVAEGAPLHGSLERGETHTTNIRLHDLGRGQVEMIFDAVTPVTIRGNINDDRVQKVMARALTTEDNPGVRLRAVSALAEDAESIGTPDPAIKEALIEALMHDGNPGVRKDALRVLSHLPFDAAVKNAMLYALLHDRNAGVRVAAINALDLTKDDARLRDNDIVNALRRTVNDDNNYVRLHARTALQEVSQ